MNYEEFLSAVVNDLKQMESFQDVSVSIQQVDKLQGESYMGLSVRRGNSNTAATMNLTGAYNDIVINGSKYDEVLAQIGEEVAEALSNIPQINVEDFLDYNALKERLMIQVVPTARNEEMLATVPHIEQEDMSLVYRFAFSDRGNASVLITNAMTEQYGITAEQLHKDAMENAPKQFTASIRDIREILAEMMGVDIDSLPEGDPTLYVATCNQGLHGAACVFYPDFLKDAAKQLNGNFFVIPSSIHEVLLLPDKGMHESNDLRQMVQDINETQVAPCDRLSNNVYFYNAEADALHIAA